MSKFVLVFSLVISSIVFGQNAHEQLTKMFTDSAADFEYSAQQWVFESLRNLGDNEISEKDVENAIGCNATKDSLHCGTRGKLENGAVPYLLKSFECYTREGCLNGTVWGFGYYLELKKKVLYDGLGRVWGCSVTLSMDSDKYRGVQVLNKNTNHEITRIIYPSAPSQQKFTTKESCDSF